MNKTKLAIAGVSVAIISVIMLSLLNPVRSGASTAETPQITGHENHNITLADAAALTANFRASAPQNAVLGEYFGRDAVQTLLNAGGSVGVRIYYGRKTDGTPVLVLVGVNENGQDLTAAGVMEYGYPCPPVCDYNSPLTH